MTIFEKSKKNTYLITHYIWYYCNRI